MMQISSTFKSAWLSPRTADYVAALIREGDSFDYCKWLQKTREGEVQAAQAFAGSAPGETAAMQCNSIQDRGWRGTPPPAAQPLRVRTLRRSCVEQATRTETKPLKLVLGEDSKRSFTSGATFSQAAHVTSCMDTWRKCLRRSFTIKCDEKPTSFGGMHLNSQIFRLTTVQIYSQPSFAALVTTTPIVRQSANGREHCGTSLIARCRRRS